MDTSMLDARLAALLPIALVVVKATAVLLVALALATVMHRASATSRHLVWVASFCALLAIPALALWSPVRFELLPASWGATPVLLPAVDASPLATGLPSTTPGTSITPSPSRRAVTAHTLPNAPAIVPAAGPASLAPLSPLAMIALIWAAVSVAMLAWLAHGAFSVRRIVRGATALDGAEWQGPMMDIADRLELTEVPALLRADDVTMPFACGVRSPTIVLPADCLQWTDERRTAVLLHELAHIRRRDIFGHTLGRVTCALYWIHPLAWMAARRLRSESERACDDLALGCGTRASDYAEHLLDIVTAVRNHGTPSVAMAMATRSEFEGRMLAILDPHLSRSAPTRMQASTLSGGVMMFAIVTGAAVPRTAAAPRQDPPVSERAELVVAHDSSTRRDERRVDVMTFRSDTTSRTQVVGGPAAPRTEPQPVAVAMPAARAEAVARAHVVAQATIQDGVRDQSTPVVRTAVDSSARASVLARILRTDTAASLRRTAAWGLHEFTDNDAALDALLYAVKRDASPLVREMAAWSLSEGADRATVASVLGDVIRDDHEPRVRKTAVWALGNGANGSDAAAMTALASALGNDDSMVREEAAWGLGNASPRRAPSALVAALTDHEPRVRATAAWALFQIEDAETASAIEAALQKETEPQAKWAMVRAISVMGERAVGPLQRIIEGSDAQSRALAIRALAGRSGDAWPQPRPQPRPFP